MQLLYQRWSHGEDAGTQQQQRHAIAHLQVGGRGPQCLASERRKHRADALALVRRQYLCCREHQATGQPRGWWVYTGHTGPNPLLWQRLRSIKVAHLVIETAFSDEERQLARISRHLCPTALGHELAHLEGSVDVHITHIKPGESEAVMAEIGRLGSAHRIHALVAGQVMRV